MDAQRVHALMAAGLADPDRLSRWRGKPDVLGQMTASVKADQAGTFIDGLWKFAGMGEKIRYTNCRHDLPLTFRILALAGLEIDVFANFTKHASALRRQGKNSSQDKIAELVAFLRGWHDPGDRNHVLLWDLLRHEATIAELEQAKILERPIHSALESPGAQATPYVVGSLRLHHMHFDPRRVATELRKQEPCLESIEASAVCLGYWLSPAGPMRLIEVDALVFDLLDLVDGSRTICEIAEQFGQSSVRIEPELALRAFTDLQDAGLVGLR